MQRALISSVSRQWRQNSSLPLLHLVADHALDRDREAPSLPCPDAKDLAPSPSTSLIASSTWTSRRTLDYGYQVHQGPTPFGARHASFWPWRSSQPAASPSEASTSLSGFTDRLLPPSGDDDSFRGPDEFFPLQETSLEVVTSIQQACTAIEMSSISMAKADAWFAASWFIHGIQGVHDSTGLPWWASIAAVNITVRCVMFPLMIYNQKNMSKIVKFNHDLLHAKRLQDAMSKASTQEESNRLNAAFRSEYSRQVAKSGDPVKMGLMMPFIMIANGAVFIAVFNGVSKLMESKAPSLLDGGALWFNDLTVSDPYFGLPIICCLSTLAMVEYGMAGNGDQMAGSEQQTSQARMLKWFMRAASFMFLPMGNFVVAGSCMLWVSNSMVAILQGVLMRSDKFRTTLGLPTMPEMKKMNAEVAAQQAAEKTIVPAGTGPSIPVDEDTGLPQFSTSPPRKVRTPQEGAYRPKTAQGIRRGY